mmetsp:Transcript_6640/g.11856  ORF Transcript_6640/g.11856 Transcript_6640/m.11856 type:complete len:566 (-) Transcript_6640:1016-2713(-)
MFAFLYSSLAVQSFRSQLPLSYGSEKSVVVKNAFCGERWSVYSKCRSKFHNETLLQSSAGMDKGTGIVMQTERKEHYGTQMRRFQRHSAGLGDELCVTVGVAINQADKKSNASNVRLPSGASLEELAALAETAGMKVVGCVQQNLDAPIAATYIGTGKVSEVSRLLNGSGAKTVVFDDELSPAQQRNLERAFGGEAKGIKVLDRTALILDIFAQHAQTREGKLQVQLALYQYRLPRLTKMWTHLERQSGMGGVGLRGPGETQLEVDRRLIQDKISQLKRAIDTVKIHRSRQRIGRKRLGVPVVAVVGYSNAGKSSFINAMSADADLLAEDMLFATLDTKTCLAELPGLKLQPNILLTDTVGFVQKLPTQLVAAFRATLEEVKEADVCIHLVDVSSEHYPTLQRAVNEILGELGAGDKPQIVVWNKTDLLDEEQLQILQKRAELEPQPTVLASVKTGSGLTECILTLEETLRDLMMYVEVLLPFSKGNLVAEMHERGVVERETHRSNGTVVAASVPADMVARLKDYRIDLVEEESETEWSEDEDTIVEGSEEYWKRLAKKRPVHIR